MTDNAGVASTSAGLSSPPAALDAAVKAQALVDDLVNVPWGRTSPSIYETGRLVALAPWLRGHADRLRFLTSTQRPDGGWGGPGGYALVPTLSATEAVLSALSALSQLPALRSPPHGEAVDIDGLSQAAGRGLARLFAWLRDGPAPPLPDTPAIELIVPALVEEINGHLAALADAPPPGLDAWRGARLPPPRGMDDGLLGAVRARLAAGDGVPGKLLHALEVGGREAAGAPGVCPVEPGTIGASPAHGGRRGGPVEGLGHRRPP
ncbi:hypothetical protein AB0K60_31845, partial [Thermopolyspora sp. NPDC052614]